MDNPYWHTDGQRHHINTETIEILCFELLNIFEASCPIAEKFEEQESELGEEQTIENYPLLQLHQKYAFIQISKLLLQIALVLRTFDDQMKDSDNQKVYKEYIEKIDDGKYVGMIEGQDMFNYREACNKIIHASEIRPLYERVDRKIAGESENLFLNQDVWYLTGEIELSGKHGDNKWNANIHVQEFIETILDLIRFK